MFMTGSGMENADQGRKLGSSGDTILVVAKADLFSECMVEALAKKFPNCEVASITSTKPMLEKDASDMKLVLFYHIPGPELHEALQAARENHPETSIGLVVEAIDMLEPMSAGWWKRRIIDGVLPLNLRLDVFMAAWITDEAAANIFRQHFSTVSTTRTPSWNLRSIRQNRSMRPATMRSS